MYRSYFGFNEKPFSLTPNPRYLFLSRHHREAFAHLLYGIDSHYGFIALTGEVGTGKTTVLRTLLTQLNDDQYRTALVFNPPLSAIELLKNIASEFGIETGKDQSSEIITSLNRFLLDENGTGKTVVLVIDEAQNLSPEVLEQIRLLSNLETSDDKLIQIILAGQPELEQLLQRPELRQLNQRIAIRYRLRPMKADEAENYLKHRMEVAGNINGVSFTKAAMRIIYLNSTGIPRTINILADRCLVIAYGNEKREVTAVMATKASYELADLPENYVIPSKWLLYGLFLFIILMVLGIVLIIYKRPAGTA